MGDEYDIEPLLVKYIVGEATDQEIAQIRAWLKAHPENQQYFVQLYDAWQASMLTNADDINIDHAYSDFSANYLLEKPKAKKWFFNYAPLFILVITLGVAIWYFNQAKTAGTANAVKLSTVPGSVRKYELPDHTVIWLNAGSTLTIDPDFNVANRTVYLQGEAFFEIGHAKDQFPFLVKTSKFSIRDIGTKFNVKAYPSDTFFEASVMAGEVSVENRNLKKTGNNRIYLKANQVLRVSHDDVQQPAAIIVDRSDVFDRIQVQQIPEGQQLNYSGWKDNILAFTNSSLEEIATQLGRHYNVSLNITDDKLKQIKYSGTFKNVATVELVLEMIKENTDINYTKQGNTITITGGKNMK